MCVCVNEQKSTGRDVSIKQAIMSYVCDVLTASRSGY